MRAHRRSSACSALLILASFASPTVAQTTGSAPAATPQPPPAAVPAATPASASPGQTANPAAAAVPAGITSAFGEITGIVKSGNTALPGVSVSASNTLTGKKYVTSTDTDGSYKIAVGAKGRYVVRAEFSAFAPITQEIVINEQNRTGKADLSMILLSRAQREAQQEQRQQMAQQVASLAGRQMQQLSLSSNSGDSGGPSMGGSDPASIAGAGLPNAGLAAEGNESVAVSGNMGRSEQNLFDPGEMQDRLTDLREQLAQQGGGTGTISLGGGGTANIQVFGG